MKRVLKHILVIILFFTTTACKITSITYRYSSNGDKLFGNAKLLDDQDKNSPVNYIDVTDNEHQNSYVKFVSPTIEIFDNKGKKYILKVNYGKKSVNVLEQGVLIREPFKANLGKVKRKDGSIVVLPLLEFQQYMKKEKWNPILDTINIDTQEKVFSGTVEDYEKERNKTKTKK